MSCYPIRVLIPVSLAFLAIPIIFNELTNFYAIPVFYFFGSYFIFINFPRISEVLHEKPTFVDDLILKPADNGKSDDHTFKKIYLVTMNFILALLFACFSEYVIVQGVDDKPIIEILGIIGGVLSLYLKVQNSIGKILLTVCNMLKETEVRRRSISDA